MKTSKAAVVANSAFGKIVSIIGYIFGPLMLLVLLFGLPEEDTVGTAVICIILIAFSVLAIIKGVQIKRRVKRFKQYVSLISGQQMTSLENIAASTNQTVDFVGNDLKKMIKSRFFAQAKIDTAANEIVIGGTATRPKRSQTQTELEDYICSGCDAQGSKPKGSGGICDYCGSPV